MIWFFVAYCLVYAFLQIMLYVRLRPILPKTRFFGLAFFVWALCMILAPAVLRILDSRGIAPPYAWPGLSAYLWMGFIMTTSLLSVLSWIIQIPLTLLLKSLHHRKTLARVLAVMVLVAGLSSMTYGWYEANNLKTTRFTIYTQKLTSSSSSIKIAFFADLHLGLVRRPTILKQLSAIINKEKPDIILAGGDVVDGRLPRHDPSEPALSKLKSPWGKFAVLGNHEFYVGQTQATAFLERCGFKVLRDKAVSINNILNLVGVDDPGRKGWATTEVPILKSALNKNFTIFLKHRPVNPPNSEGLFDLQLSGHTHGGQIFPMNYLVKLLYPYIEGPYKLSNSQIIFTTKGAGAWGPPLRILTRPEVVIITVKKG